MTANTINYFAFPGMMNMATYMPKLTERMVNKCIYLTYGVTLVELMGKTRVLKIVRLRHSAMYLIKTNTNKSLKSIGKYYRRDHTSVMNAISKIQAAKDGYNNELKQIYEELEQAVMAEYVRKMTKFEEHEKV